MTKISISRSRKFLSEIHLNNFPFWMTAIRIRIRKSLSPKICGLSVQIVCKQARIFIRFNVQSYPIISLHFHLISSTVIPHHLWRFLIIILILGITINFLGQILYINIWILANNNDQLWLSHYFIRDSHVLWLFATKSLYSISVRMNDVRNAIAHIINCILGNFRFSRSEMLK